MGQARPEERLAREVHPEREALQVVPPAGEQVEAQQQAQLRVEQELAPADHRQRVVQAVQQDR